MPASKKIENISQDNKVLTLNKEEWDNFQKELSQPKPSTNTLKKLIRMKKFDTNFIVNNK